MDPNTGCTQAVDLSADPSPVPASPEHSSSVMPSTSANADTTTPSVSPEHDKPSTSANADANADANKDANEDANPSLAPSPTAPSASPEHSPSITPCASPTPSSSTPSTPGPKEDEALLIRHSIARAKKHHLLRGQIYAKTRHWMRGHTNTIYVNSLRGFERSKHAPTKRTLPSLHRRRYSVDVMTKNASWLRKRSIRIKAHENEPAINSVPQLKLPDASRFFADPSNWNPPNNNDVYLQLGDATIKNNALHKVVATFPGENLDAWMDGDILNMAMEILRQETKCAAFGIDIASSNHSQIFSFASRFEDAENREYDDYRFRFRNTSWIFAVVNDAMSSVLNIVGGTHWSLIALNRQAREIHYYDSLPYSEQRSEVGRDVATGLLCILGEDLEQWRFWIEQHTPNQQKHNQFHGDFGPCGPFVYKLTEMLINRIQAFQAMGKEHECKLELVPEFGAHFAPYFDSLKVRQDIQRFMVYYKNEIDHCDRIENHDSLALEHEEVLNGVDDVPFLNITPPASPR